MTKKPVIAIIAAYNEESRIQEVITGVLSYVDTIIVIDDGSTDSTTKNIQPNKKVIVLQHICNLGQGAALQTGFDYAKTLNPAVVITYDADGQFAPSDIPLVIKPILTHTADIVLGSRFLEKRTSLPLIKYFLLKGAVLFTYIFSSIKLSDSHNGFRALSQYALHKINLSQNKMAHASEFLDQISYHELKFKEVPVTVTYDSYSMKKGQKPSNSINILFNLIFSKIQ